MQTRSCKETGAGVDSKSFSGNCGELRMGGQGLCGYAERCHKESQSSVPHPKELMLFLSDSRESLKD